MSVSSPLEWIVLNCKGCKHVRKGYCYVALNWNGKREQTTTVARRYFKRHEDHCLVRNHKEASK
jgi:hypothetical protein